MENGKHPLRNMIPSALYGRIYYSERTLHFDGFDSRGVCVVGVTDFLSITCLNTNALVESHWFRAVLSSCCMSNTGHRCPAARP
jgi:hypothetical protein